MHHAVRYGTRGGQSDVGAGAVDMVVRWSLLCMLNLMTYKIVSLSLSSPVTRQGSMRTTVMEGARALLRAGTCDASDPSH